MNISGRWGRAYEPLFRLPKTRIRQRDFVGIARVRTERCVGCLGGIVEQAGSQDREELKIDNQDFVTKVVEKNGMRAADRRLAGACQPIRATNLSVEDSCEDGHVQEQRGPGCSQRRAMALRRTSREEELGRCHPDNLPTPPTSECRGCSSSECSGLDKQGSHGLLVHPCTSVGEISETPRKKCDSAWPSCMGPRGGGSPRTSRRLSSSEAWGGSAGHSPHATSPRTHRRRDFLVRFLPRDKRRIVEPVQRPLSFRHVAALRRPSAH